MTLPPFALAAQLALFRERIARVRRRERALALTLHHAPMVPVFRRDREGHKRGALQRSRSPLGA